jgi:hypothetical protein
MITLPQEFCENNNDLNKKVANLTIPLKDTSKEAVVAVLTYQDNHHNIISSIIDRQSNT